MLAALLATASLDAFSQYSVGKTVCFQPEAGKGVDAFLSSLAPTTNYATHQDFISTAWTVNGNPITVRSLLQFPQLSGIPSTALVTNATLDLYFNPTSSNGPNHSQLSGSNASTLLRVTGAWNESTVTWNTQPATSTGTTTTDIVALPASSSGTQNYSINVTDMVQFWVANPTQNFGFLLRLVTESYYRRLLFASSDHPTTSLHPRLCVSYQELLPNPLCFQPDATSGQDAFLSSLLPTTNYSNHQDFIATAWTVSGSPITVRSLLQFNDLSIINPSNTISNATLYLYFNPTSSNGSNHSQLSGSNIATLRRVTANWSENTVTWNTQPSVSAGAGLADVVSVPASTSGTQNYAIDVTAMVQSWITNPSTNYGFMFRLVTESYYRRLLFASSDHGTAGIRPQLCITFPPLKRAPIAAPAAAPAEEMLVFPNPSSGDFQVRFAASSQGRKLELWNTQGQLIWRHEAAEEDFHASRGQLPAGMYILRASTPDGLIQNKTLVLQ
jgi:hypothetical protein